MKLVRNSEDEGARASGTGPSTAELFTLLWGALSDLLGTAATAVLIRRAALRALAISPELSQLTISRLNLEYRYILPQSWENRTEGTGALRTLFLELEPLLLELTGRIAIRRLEKIDVLRVSGLLAGKEQS